MFFKINYSFLKKFLKSINLNSINILFAHDFSVLKWWNQFLQTKFLKLILRAEVLLNKYVSFLYWISIIPQLKLNECVVSLNLNKYYSLKLHKYTFTGCDTNTFCWEWIYILFIRIFFFCKNVKTEKIPQI